MTRFPPRAAITPCVHEVISSWHSSLIPKKAVILLISHENYPRCIELLDTASMMEQLKNSGLETFETEYDRLQFATVMYASK